MKIRPLPLFAPVLAILLGACAGLPAERPKSAAAAPAQERTTELRHCLQSTGSLILRTPGDCLPATGRVIGLQEMERTGAPVAGDALGRLLNGF